MLAAALSSDAAGQVFNLGHADALGLGEIAHLVADAAGAGSTVTLVPWPDDAARIDIGSFQGDYSKAKRILSWTPDVGFPDGIADTVSFYRGNPWYLSST
jgi:dTDP-glucose 4,6-dehydratase